VWTRLIIVTARSEETRRQDTENWVNKYFGEITFDEIWFSGEFAAIHSRLEGGDEASVVRPTVRSARTKSEVRNIFEPSAFKEILHHLL
jgi:hypothetical protein